jgi:hypothetical protein
MNEHVSAYLHAEVLEAAVAYEEAFKLKPTSSLRQRLESLRERLSGNGRRPPS